MDWEGGKGLQKRGESEAEARLKCHLDPGKGAATHSSGIQPDPSPKQKFSQEADHHPSLACLVVSVFQCGRFCCSPIQ